ncbi:MAG: response regulator [Cyanobacteria bacterium RM1_2_2]|nr:response regulator [Cyanobacteria bacterium RM1_2_2]
MKILLVEDDAPTAAVLSEVITAQHYTVDVATDGEMGLQFATSWEYDLILLDLLIPKLDGMSLCRQLRVHGFQKPILLLTVKDSSTDVVKGLDAGADDYVTKPYNLSELLARMRALLRRKEADLVPPLLTWGQLCVNPVSAEVTYGQQLLSLSPKEYGLLGLFLRNPQRVFSRSDIIDRLWSIDASPSEGAVTNLIKDLRQKLKASGMGTDLLETVYGLGYRLKAPPEQADPSPQTASGTSSGTSKPAKKPKANSPKSLASINKVLERYQNTFVGRVVTLEQIELALLTGTLDGTQQQSAAQEAHRLAGALGSFGYEAGSQLARSIEQLLNGPLTFAEVDQYASLVAELKQELLKPPTPLAARIPEPAATPVVLVIDHDADFTAQLKQDAFAWGLRVEVITDLTIAQQRMREGMNEAAPRAVLLSLQESIDAKLTLLRELEAQFPTVPVLVITEQDSLTERVVVSRFGVKRFLRKPIPTADVFEAIADVLPKAQAPIAKVLILDDDQLMLDILHDLLQPWGLQVTTLHDPQQFWDVLTATKPDLLVMDLEMPTFNGIDLCRVVRQDAKWGNLPILVVTAHTSMESIQQVFAAGADDFIGKPVVGPELVTRVISRIDRSRLQQELETMKRRIGT